jgi:hypothetical protein
MNKSGVTLGKAFLSAVFTTAVVFGYAPCFADILAGTYTGTVSSELGRVYRLDDHTGDVVSGGIPSGMSGIDSIAGLAVGPDGRIYVSSQDQVTGGGAIFAFDGTTGAPVGAVPFINFSDASHPNSQPGPIRFGPDGNIYVADFGTTHPFTSSHVRVFSPAGMELPPAATFINKVGGIAFAANGDMYVGNFGTNSVMRVRNGMMTNFIPSDGNIGWPSSALVLPDGDLLVASMRNNRILRYSTDGATGVLQGVFAEVPLMGDEIDNPPTNFPSDLSFDQDGNVMLAVLGPTVIPHEDRGQILRFALEEGSVAGIPLGPLVENYPPLSSAVWVASPDAILGDYNSDDIVDDFDYEKWKADYGKWVAKGGGADGNADGTVNAADYTVWRNALSSSLAAGAEVVPEPGGVLLFGVAVFVILATPRAAVRNFGGA